MKHQFRVVFCIIAGLGLCFSIAQYSSADIPRSSTGQKEAVVPHDVSGSFDVKLTPQQPEPAIADSGIGRMLLEKQYHGGLEATSKGQMLWFGDPAKGSAGLVAIERVTGTLAGRSGSFALQHSSSMNRGAMQISVTVVPESGTDQLTGLAGSMTIQIENGKHSYQFDYTLPEAP
jgi:hypothetical protein